MLSEQVQEWTREWVEEGREQGIAQGREQGPGTGHRPGPRRRTGAAVSSGGAEVRRRHGATAGGRAGGRRRPRPLDAGRGLDHRVRDAGRADCPRRRPPTGRMRNPTPGGPFARCLPRSPAPKAEDITFMSARSSPNRTFMSPNRAFMSPRRPFMSWRRSRPCGFGRRSSPRLRECARRGGRVDDRERPRTGEPPDGRRRERQRPAAQQAHVGFPSATATTPAPPPPPPPPTAVRNAATAASSTATSVCEKAWMATAHEPTIAAGTASTSSRETPRAKTTAGVARGHVERDERREDACAPPPRRCAAQACSPLQRGARRAAPLRRRRAG